MFEYYKNEKDIQQNGIKEYLLFQNIYQTQNQSQIFFFNNQQQQILQQENYIENKNIKRLNENFSKTCLSQFYSETLPISTFKTQLFNYQKQGLTWMLYREGRISKKQLFENHPEQYQEDRELNPFYQQLLLPYNQKIYHNILSGKVCTDFVYSKHTFGGILADQMGLGKTLMTIALIHSDLQNKREFSRLGTLVVLPLSILGQWQRELENNSVEKSIKIFNYYQQKKPQNYNLEDYDIVLIPYSQLANEYKRNNKQLFQNQWRRIILDEAQNIKNRKSNIAKACFLLNSQYRWCLTATPIENILDDLFSLLQFLNVETFGEWFWWNSYINDEQKKSDSFDLLHQILKPLILRRTKQSKYENGQCILQMTNKQIFTEKIQMEKQEKKLYDLLFSQSQKLFQELNNKKEVINSYIHIFQIISKLRQFCAHPSIVFKGFDIDKLKNINLNILQEQVYSFLEGKTSKKTQQNQYFLNKQNSQETVTEAYKKELIQKQNKESLKYVLFVLNLYKFIL
ncbi:hypothetical protein IMG5_162580 [Ichthyophthirius multifiliis]|uniref:Helicase ATP-binding domain-containing protein n=1 Tax=Ichthyophthirius multifiliis TaxID=5932 RepID=G0R086_ICHMU|nr:hypothetical protein IMG5_162580 [Ichthyophthirius multifiliis]EGR29118.1 hypothetical protein IMG5_162580 [Ichthyophthirius multifiliis]|eukprot:XP_004030354.1 hypothetical protein IMG5_162580 [Ichthyophthirius multifiliis]